MVLKVRGFVAAIKSGPLSQYLRIFARQLVFSRNRSVCDLVKLRSIDDSFCIDHFEMDYFSVDIVCVYFEDFDVDFSLRYPQLKKLMVVIFGMVSKYYVGYGVVLRFHEGDE
jgi:hypothetical protein